MSIFEAAMLVCFGAAWPASLYKSWTSRTSAGKSVVFLFVVEVGYLSGVTHKLLYNFDGLTWLYALNAAMVAADIALYFRNRRFGRLVGV